MTLLQVPPADPLVPVLDPSPAQTPDPKTVIDTIIEQITAAAAPDVGLAGMDLWRALGAILIVWTGLRIAFSGDLRPWDLVRLFFALWFPWAMLTFYSTPLPGSTLSFTGAIVGGGTWLQGLLVGGAASDWMDAYLRLANNLFDRGTEIEAGGGLMSLILSGITSIQTTIMGFINTVIFEVFLCLIALMLIVIYAVTMAQVIWAQLALGILLILGPIFIPFLMIEPMAFLFWGWFKGLWVYSLYAAIAAALMRVFLAASLGYITAIMSPPAGTNDLWHAVAWTISLVPLMVAGLLSSLMVGTLASQLVGGGGGGSGVMGLIGQASQAFTPKLPAKGV